MGSVEDIAAAVIFVAGPGAGFMTGETLNIDGGWTAYGYL
jgi:NAD(P)-dependent dehydrogenase (short-subunit alcohol dehydrogenase family)